MPLNTVSGLGKWTLVTTGSKEVQPLLEEGEIVFILKSEWFWSLLQRETHLSRLFKVLSYSNT